MVSVPVDAVYCMYLSLLDCYNDTEYADLECSCV